jgi:hypothetical protein
VAVRSVPKPGTARSAARLHQTTKQPPTSEASKRPREDKVANIDKSQTMQEQRKKLINKLINQGIFQKVEMPGSFPSVWVKPGFYSLDFDTKDKFVVLSMRTISTVPI